MSNEMNIEWMDEYEKTYVNYKQQWDFHYQKVKDFIYKSMNKKIENWGFIGVTNTVPEINHQMLERVEKLTLLDINEKSMVKAKEYIINKYDFDNIELKRFDNTVGFTDLVLDVFQKHEDKQISEDLLFEKLGGIKQLDITEFKNLKFDYITHLGLMDYYMMPIFNEYCENLKHRNDEFFSVLRKLSDDSVQISLKVLFNILDTSGSLIISTPFTRIPEGGPCKRSLFWLKPLEEYLRKAGFDIITKSEHLWEEFPIPEGHSHKILNIHCKRIEK